MIELISKGGPLMWLLLACSILAAGIFAERLFLFHRSTINVGEFLQGLSNLIQKRNYAEALHECAGTPGPVARVIHSAVIRHESPRAELKEIVQESGQLEVPRLERYLSVMMTIAYIAPLIGLLGTVIGLVDAFVQFNTLSGQATIGDLSKGVYQSLITSAAGLVVAIPTFILYSYLATYARTLMHDMERGGIEVVNIIEDARKNSEIVSFAEGKSAAARTDDETDGEAGQEAGAVTEPMKLESTLQPRRGMLHFASMLDIVFLLLLFFLLSSNAVVRSGIAVVPPQSRSALKAAATADIITLSSGNPPQIFYNDRRVTMAELEVQLRRGEASGSRKQVVLRAGEVAPYGQIIRISNLVVGNGYSLILATRPEPAG